MPRGQAQTYTALDIGTLGTWGIVPTGINNSGQVAGYFYSDQVTTHSFLYSGGKMMQLDANVSRAWAINSAGQAVGYSGPQAVLYSGGSIIPLIGSSGVPFTASGINDSGQIVVTGTNSGVSLLYSNGKYTSLGTSLAFASGINNSGQVMGAVFNIYDESHAALYSAGTVTDLGTLGGPASAAYGLNDNGEVVGISWTANQTDPNAYHAFLYSGGKMIDLGEGTAFGINNSGQVVGYSAAFGPFLYSGGKMINLNDVASLPTGVSLEYARAINDVGQIVAGDGSHVYLLTPTSPGAPPLTVTPTSLPNAISGQPYPAPGQPPVALAATGGSGADYLWCVEPGCVGSGPPLPPGFTLSLKGILSSTGNPAAPPGTYPFGVLLIDSAGNDARGQFTLVVEPPIQISPTTLPTANSGAPYPSSGPPAIAFTATGGSGKPYTWCVQSAAGCVQSGPPLPPGFTLSSGGELNSTGSPPAPAGTYPIVVQVTDSVGGKQTQTLSLSVACPILVTKWTGKYVEHSGTLSAYIILQATSPDGTPIIQYAKGCGYSLNWQQGFTVLPPVSSLTPELPAVVPNNVYPASCALEDLPGWLYGATKCYLIAGGNYPPLTDPPQGGYVPFMNGQPQLNQAPRNPYPFYYYQLAIDSPGGSCTLPDAKPGYPNNCPPFPYVLSEDFMTLSFLDDPAIHELQPGQFVAFQTALVGTDSQGTVHSLHSWWWYSTFNGTAGGVDQSEAIFPIDPGSGTGGVTITNIDGVQLPSPIPPGQVTVTASGLAYSPASQTSNGTLTFTNTGNSIINGPLQIVLFGVPVGVSLVNATGNLSATPYITVPAGSGLAPGQSVTVSVQFENPPDATINPTPAIYSGSFSSTTVSTPQTIIVTNPAPATAVYGTSFAVLATATSGLPVAIATSGACSGSGTASANITITSASGACTVNYNQPGNATYGPAPQVQNFTIPTLTGSSPASGTTCNGAYSGVFNGNITVASGQTCTFYGGGVTGNVTQSGGTLELNNAAIGGNVQVQGGGTISVLSAAINGNLQIQNLPVGSAGNLVCGSHIRGNLTFQNNSPNVAIGGAPGCSGSTIVGNLQVQNNIASTMISGNNVGGDLQDQNNVGSTQVIDNSVGGNLQVQNNTGPSTLVSKNSVTNNLQCQNNSPPPKGSGNTVRGNPNQSSEGQCQGF